MHFKIHQQMEYIAANEAVLKAGDMLLTGSPEGYGPIRVGDEYHATLK